MTIKLHDLKPAPGSKTAKTRVGRGEGSKGKTAGRGTKGTKARKNVPVTFEGGQMPIHMRLPKLKGFTQPLPHRVRGRQRRRHQQAVPQGRHRRYRRAGRRGRGPQEHLGQGARRRQADRQGRRHRAQVQRQRAREDHRRRRIGDRSFVASSRKSPTRTICRRGLACVGSPECWQHFSCQPLHLLAILGDRRADRVEQDHLGSRVDHRAKAARRRPPGCPTPAPPRCPASPP